MDSEEACRPLWILVQALSSIQVTERYAHLAPHKLAHAAMILDELG